MLNKDRGTIAQEKSGAGGAADSRGGGQEGEGGNRGEGEGSDGERRGAAEPAGAPGS